MKWLFTQSLLLKGKILVETVNLLHSIVEQRLSIHVRKVNVIEKWQKGCLQNVSDIPETIVHWKIQIIIRFYQRIMSHKGLFSSFEGDLFTFNNISVRKHIWVTFWLDFPFKRAQTSAGVDLLTHIAGNLCCCSNFMQHVQEHCSVTYSILMLGQDDEKTIL